MTFCYFPYKEEIEMPRKKGRRAVPDIVKTNAAEVLSEARKKISK